MTSQYSHNQHGGQEQDRMIIHDHEVLEIDVRGSEHIKKKPRWNKKMIIFLISVLVLVVVIIIIISRFSTAHGDDPDDKSPGLSDTKSPDTKVYVNPNPCDSESCLKIASDINKHRSLGVEPCRDFYRHSCYYWPNHHPIPSSESVYNNINVLQDRLNLALKEILDDGRKKYSGDVKALRYVFDSYAACIDEDQRERMGIWPLEEFVKLGGGWPLLDTGSPYFYPDYDIKQVMDNAASLSGQLDLAFPVSISVAKHAINGDRNVVIVQWAKSASSLSRLAESRFKNTLLGLLHSSIYDVIKELRPRKLDKLINQEIDEMLAFYVSWLLIGHGDGDDDDDDDDLKEVQYTDMTIEKFQRLTDSQYKVFNWTSILQKAFADSVDKPSVKQVIHPTFKIVVAVNPLRIVKLREFLRKQNARVIQNLVIWRAIFPLLSNLNKKMRQLHFEINSFMTGVTKPVVLWRTCCQGLTDTLGFALGLPYVQKYFPNETKTEVLDLVDRLKKSFKKMLLGNKWMRPATTVWAAIEKVDAMRVHIGFPDFIYDKNSLDTYYKQLENKLSKNDHWRNSLVLSKWVIQRNYRKLTKPIDKDEWLSPPIKVNAFYQSLNNLIEFPAGILQPPYYYANGPKAYNYGFLGYIIGHEITHGFDNTGRYFDKDGLFKEWWSSGTANEFAKLAVCYVMQYNKFCPKELDEGTEKTCVDGFRTLNENIADNGGLKQAYLAYLSWKDEFKNDSIPIGLHGMTSEKLFFYGFGQVWCSEFRKKGLSFAIKHGEHTPEPFRTTGTIMNMPEFSKVFGCATYTSMNSGRGACHLW